MLLSLLGTRCAVNGRGDGGGEVGPRTQAVACTAEAPWMPVLARAS